MDIHDLGNALAHQANPMDLHSVLRKLIRHFDQIAGDFNRVSKTQSLVRSHGRDKAVTDSQLPDHSLEPLLTHFQIYCLGFRAIYVARKSIG